MIFGGGLFAFALLALWIYCIVDVIASNESQIRNLPKLVWLLIVIFVPTIGSIVWLLLGRPERTGFAPGDSSYRAEPRANPLNHSTRRALETMAPDDDERYLAELDDRTRRMRAWEADLKRREDELRQREEDDG